MMRKLLAAVAVLSIVLVAGGAFALANLERWINDNRAWIEERAAQAVGRRVSFDELGVSLGLGIGASVTGLRLADDPAYGDRDLLAVREVRVGIRLLPALRGHYEISHVTLIEPRLHVVKTEAGFNFATLGAQPSGGTTGDAPGIAALVALIDIADGRIELTDRTSEPPVVVRMDDVESEVSDLSLESPVRFDLTATVLGTDEPNLRLRGTVGPVDTTAPARTPIAVDASADDLAAADLLRLYDALTGDSRPGGVQAEGRLHATASVSGTAESLAVEARVDATDARVSLPALLDKPRGTPLELRVDATRNGDTLGIRRARLTLLDADVDAHGTIGLGTDDAGYNLQLTAEPFELEGWLGVLPSLAAAELEAISGTAAAVLAVASADAERGETLPRLDGTITLVDAGAVRAVGADLAHLTATLVLRDGGAALAPTGMRVGASTVTVQASVDDLAKPAGTFKLESPDLDLTALGLDGTAGDDAATATHDTLRKLRVEGSYEIGAGRAALDATATSATGNLGGADVADLRARLRYDGTRFVVNPLEMDAFGGRLAGEGFYAPGGEAAAEFNFEAKASGVSVGELAASRLVATDLLLDGTLDGRLSLAGEGDAWVEIRDALVGGATVALAGGRLRDVNIAESLLQQLTGLPGLSGLLSADVRARHPKLFETGDTVFDDMIGEFSIAAGRMQSRDLSLRATDFSLHGRAGIGLDGSLDVKATFEASEALTATLVEAVDAVKYLEGSSGRVQVPFRLRGYMPDVRPEPDVGFITDALGRALMRGLADTLLEPKRDPAR